MVGVPTGLPQSRDVPTDSGMAEMFQLLSCMVGLPTGLTQSRDVPTGSCMAEMFLLWSRMVGIPTGLPHSRDVYSMVRVLTGLPYIVGMYLVHGMAEMCYCGTEQ